MITLKVTYERLINVLPVNLRFGSFIAFFETKLLVLKQTSVALFVVFLRYIFPRKFYSRTKHELTDARIVDMTNFSQQEAKTKKRNFGVFTEQDLLCNLCAI